jgi:peptidoglycan/LPS O-acetylase OafA/YrhL
LNFIPIVNHSLKYNSSLDGLRGIAILLVLFFHIWPDVFSFGYVGVDIFFVLSGFLITQIIVTKLDNNSFSFKEFYRNRIRRIFPAMIFVVFVTLLIGYLILIPNEFGVLGRHAKSALLFFQNFRLISEVGYWDQAATLKPLLHFWSLSVEEQFYLLWPFLLFGIYKARLNLLVSVGLVLVLFISIGFIIEIDHFYHSLARFWELALGGFAYILSSRFNLNSLNKFKFLVFIFFILSIASAFGNDSVSFLTTLMVTIFTALVLIVLKENSNTKILSSKFLVFFGLISFPLYLWHYVFISYLHILNYDVSNFAFEVIFISILLSYLTYRYIELYFRSQNSFKTAYKLFGIVIILSFVAQYIYAKKGLPNRSHLQGQELLEQQFKKIPHQNDNGKVLINKILGEFPNNDYIRSTSNDLNKDYVLIVGDSHSHTSYPGFAQEFKKKGLETVIFSNSGCGPYIENMQIEKCTKKIENIHRLLNRVENMDNIKKILFITRKPNLEYIKNLFESFSIKNKKLYYLLEKPSFDFAPDICIPRPFNISNQNKECKIKYSQYLDKYGKYIDYTKSLSKNYNNIQVLDAKEVFCDEEFCYSIRDNNVLYSDTNHHSVNGSKLQAQYLINKIDFE